MRTIVLMTNSFPKLACIAVAAWCAVTVATGLQFDIITLLN